MTVGAGSASVPLRRGLLRLFGPGLLLAATGVGAGDLATAAFAGGHLGVAILWAVVVGAAFKYALNEGLARYQLASGETLLEGAVRHLGRPVRWAFPVYLLPWSFFVGAALLGACGVTFHAAFPVFEDASRAKLVFGAAHGLLGLALVWVGGYRLFERIMSAAVAIMTVTVVLTAVRLAPSVTDVLHGLLVPRVPRLDAGGAWWTVALIGGVGGTLTVLGYSYWMREEAREAPADLLACRIDLAPGYAFTALFGAAMVVIGSTVAADGTGATLVVRLADRLGDVLGPWGRGVFLLGAWCAVFSSLLGVWQVVPFIFADFWRLIRTGPDPLDDPQAVERSLPYRAYLVALTVVPVLGLAFSFKRIQVAYAVVGAAFLPLLALALLLLNGRRELVGDGHRNGPLAVGALALVLVFFAAFGAWQVLR